MPDVWVEPPTAGAVRFTLSGDRVLVSPETN
jgi:hypothetical protein